MAKEPAENTKNLKMPDIDTVPLADLIEIIDHGGFESEAGPLTRRVEWQELKRRIAKLRV
jgi:hypothetical protein